MSTETNSTNVQAWTQKYTKQKPLRKAKETIYANITLKWCAILTVWAVVSVIMLFPIFRTNDWIVESFFEALILAWWGIYIIYFRTCEMFDTTLLKITFIIDEYLGNHSVTKFDMEVETLQAYVPIVDIVDKILIRFTKNRYGVLIQYWPLSEPGDNIAMERHLQAVQAIFNRLSGDMMINLIGSSRFGTPSPLLKKIEKKLNDPKTNKKNFAIWKSQYDLLKSGKVTPDWEFNAFLGLGTCATVDEAQEKLLTELPGIMDGFDDAGILAETISGKDELVKRYIQFMIPRDLL